MGETERAGDIATSLLDDSQSDHGDGPEVLPQFRSLRRLRADCPKLRPMVVTDLLREGELLNLIGGPKSYKTYMAMDLAISVALGTPFLGIFPVDAPGPVLYIDNELHPETSADRFPRIAVARNRTVEEIDEQLQVENLRGRLVAIHRMESYFYALQPGQFKLIVLDALYRFLPNGISENDNASMAQVYNTIDRYAAYLGAAFVLVHQTSKGNQSGKSVVDVGAGGGSQSRAADSHVVLRPHREPGVVVFEAAVRSLPPLAPRCLRWSYPVWNVDHNLDPADLKPERAPRRQKAPASTKPEKPQPLTCKQFVEKFLTAIAQSKDAIVLAATSAGVSKAHANSMMTLGLDNGLIHRWCDGGANSKQRFATIPQEKEVKSPARAKRRSASKKKTGNRGLNDKKRS